MAVVSSTERQADLEQQLNETGNKLSQKTLPVDQLLPLLDRVENHLSRVDQSPPMSMINALSLSLNTLVEDRYIRHSDVDVKVAVASCISEITRITAPDAPYEDELMKDVFQLIVSSFEDLSDQSSRSYTKRASILETVAKVRSCVVMLDLECDELITKMFQHFLKAIRDYHPENVFSSMETIMTLVIDESENISLELLTPILATLKKDNENVLPVAFKLGEKVFEKTADKLKPYLAEAVKSLGYPLEDYSQIVAVICNATSGTSEQKDDNASGQLAEEVKLNKSSAEEAAQAEASKLTTTSSTETTQAEANKLTTASSTETTQVAKEGVNGGSSPVVDGSSKSVMSNGIMETGNEKPSVDQDSFHADSEKETEKLHDSQNSRSKDDQSSPGEDPSTKAGAPSENENDTEILPSSPKASEGETTKAAVSSPSRSLSVEMHLKKGGGPKKIHTSAKVDEPSADVPDIPTKVPEETSELKVDAPTENENDTDTLPSPKALEVETTKDAASSPGRSLPVEINLKKGGQPKKKQTSTKVNEPSTDVPTKAPQGTSELEVDNAPSANKNENDTLPSSSSKALEVETTKAAASSPSRSLPDESRSKKSARSKKKQTSTKVDKSSTTDVPMKVPEGTSELEVDALSEKENDTDTQVETTKAAASPSSSLPDASRSKKGARAKKKQTSTKVDKPSTDVPTKAPEGTNELEVKQQRRPGKKVPAGTMKEDKVPSAVVKSKSEDGKISGSEGITPKQASKKVDTDDEDAKPSSQTLKKGDAGDSEAKLLKQPGNKKGIKSPESKPLIQTVKKGDASTPEAKALKQSGKKGNTSKSVEDKSSLKNKEKGKKRGREQDATEKDSAKSCAKDDDKVSSLKSTIKSAKKDDHFEEPNTTDSKRMKRTPGKEKATETAELGVNLVGSKIKVWWPKDRAFYDGVIKFYDSAKKKHTVLYTDDEVEILNLKTERWEFVEDGSMSNEGEATKDSSPNGSSEKHKKKKAKTDVEPSPAQEDPMEISPKRVGASSSSKLKAPPTSKSGSKSNKAEEKADNKSKDKTSKSGGESVDHSNVKSKDKSQKGSGKCVDETSVPKSGAKSKDVDVVTPKTSSKSKQDASSKTVSKSKGKATTTQSGSKSNANGSGKMKSSSLKALKESLKESDNEKESSVDSEKTTEDVKEKSPETTSKVKQSGTKSGKKRKRRY